MSEIRRKILDGGKIPLMSGEGMSELIRVSVEFLRNGKIKLRNGDTYIGYNTTRIIRLEGHKERVSDEYVDELVIAGTRCDVLCAILKKLREEPDITKVKQGIERIFPAVIYMSDDEVRAIINTTDEAIYGYFVDGKEAVPEVLKKMYDEYTHYGEHAGGREKLPYECISGHDAENTYRIYMNLPQNKTTYEFWRRFRLKCIERGVSYDAKTSNSVSGDNTLDGQIIYVSEEEADIVFGILEELAVEIPEITEVAGTPISGAMQYSYYSIGTARIQGGNTFNNACNHLTQRAFYCAIAREILKDKEFCSKLSAKQIECLQLFANYENHSVEIANGQIGGFGNKMLSWKEVKTDPYTGKTYEIGYNDWSLISSVMNQYVKTHDVEDSLEFREYFEEAFKGLFSCFNYGDFEHTDMPIALPKEFFEGMGMEMPKRETSTPKPSMSKSSMGTSKPKTTVTKPTSTAITPEQHKNVVQNIDDAMMKVIKEFMVNYEKDPAVATETLLTKMAALKKQYIVSASALGETNTPKYEYIMTMFERFEQFTLFAEDPTKGSGINLVNRKRHYREMAGAVKGRAQTIGMALANFDAAEDREVKEEKSEVKPKTDEKERRRQVVENIGALIGELFNEFLENFDSNPAGATAEFLTKLDKLKREYMVAASLMDGEKKSKRYTRAMHIFNKFEAYGVYKPESAKVDENTYYTTIAPHVRGEAISLKNAVIRLDDFDIKD